MRVAANRSAENMAFVSVTIHSRGVGVGLSVQRSLSLLKPVCNRLPHSLVPWDMWLYPYNQHDCQPAESVCKLNSIHRPRHPCHTTSHCNDHDVIPLWSLSCQAQ